MKNNRFTKFESFMFCVASFIVLFYYAYKTNLLKPWVYFVVTIIKLALVGLMIYLLLPVISPILKQSK